jgi:hypothetical protein
MHDLGVDPAAQVTVLVNAFGLDSCVTSDLVGESARRHTHDAADGSSRVLDGSTSVTGHVNRDRVCEVDFAFDSGSVAKCRPGDKLEGDVSHDLVFIEPIYRRAVPTDLERDADELLVGRGIDAYGTEHRRITNGTSQVVLATQRTVLQSQAGLVVGHELIGFGQLKGLGPTRDVGISDRRSVEMEGPKEWLATASLLDPMVHTRPLDSLDRRTQRGSLGSPEWAVAGARLQGEPHVSVAACTTCVGDAGRTEVLHAARVALFPRHRGSRERPAESVDDRRLKHRLRARHSRQKEESPGVTKLALA